MTELLKYLKLKRNIHNFYQAKYAKEIDSLNREIDRLEEDYTKVVAEADKTCMELRAKYVGKSPTRSHAKTIEDQQKLIANLEDENSSLRDENDNLSDKLLDIRKVLEN